MPSMSLSVIEQHEIAEAEHRILNPFTEEKLMLLGEVCRPEEGQSLLDLACGKGEMLCRWSQRFGIGGHGVDVSSVFLAAAAERARELGVAERVSFEQADAARAVPDEPGYDLVSCIGATWIGGGLAGTIDLMRPAVRPGGLLLVGEPYWTEPPPEAAPAALGLHGDEYVTLIGTLDRLEAAGTELIEMVLADADSWDRYVASQWWTVERWLRDNPRHPGTDDMRVYLRTARRAHLEFQRRYLGWGVFVLRPR